MAIGLSFVPSTTGDLSGTSGGSLTPAQSAIQVLRLNLPAIAAQARFSPLAASGPSAHQFAPETIVAQTLLRTLSGNGVPNPTLMDHLTNFLQSVGQVAPTQPPAPTITPGSTGNPAVTPGAGTGWLGAPGGAPAPGGAMTAPSGLSGMGVMGRGA
jgi:hypothetical protein